MSARRPLSDSLRPDPAFVRNLAFDSLLWVRWNRAQAKWQIFRREHLVMTVQDEDMSYRPLDNRTIDTLRRADWFCRSPKAILDEIERENLQAEAAVDRDFDNYLESVGRRHGGRWRRNLTTSSARSTCRKRI